jgi:hypothetical protein
MPSAVTSIIGGFQGASAAHNAANAQAQGYGQAGQTVTQAAQSVNPDILATAQQQGQNVTDVAGRGAQGAVDAASAGGAGATGAAQKFMDLLSPYISGGSTAMSDLMSGLAPGGSLSQPFTASMMSQYSPAYQFQLQQGQQAAQRQAAAMGLTGSGGTAKSLSRYAQDYANTAFSSAANLYNQQQTNQYNRLMGVAGMGQQAATTGGQAQQQAAEYAGTLGEQAAQYAGTMNTGAAQWAGTQNINARNLASQNTLSAANYLANTQIGAGNAIAQGDLGAAASWNQMLGGIGSAANSALIMGFDPSGGGGWNFSNIGPNMGSMFGRGMNMASNTPPPGFTPYSQGKPFISPFQLPTVSGWTPGGGAATPSQG